MNKKGFFGIMALFVGAMLVSGGGQVFAQTKEECQEIIQRRCKFNSVEKVWFAIDKLGSNANYVYQKWAASYGSNGNAYYNMPAMPEGKDKAATDAYKAMILQRCSALKGVANSVWDVIEKHHGYPADLIRVWAQSYYMKR